jgi:hypothetical protein
MFTKETVEKNEFPPAGEHVLVQCRGFRCLAYRGADGKWWTVYNNQELKDVLEVLPLGQDADY